MLMACSTAFDAYRSTYRQFDGIDPRLSGYLDSFMIRYGHLVDPKTAEGLTMGISVVGFTNTNAVGRCYYSKLPDGGREISISYWDFSWYSESQREELVFHELGHCLCNLDHTHKGGTYREPDKEYPSNNLEEWPKLGYLPDGCPASTMYPRVMGSDCYEKHRELYLQDILNRCNKE
jgi:hypothetical protein